MSACANRSTEPEEETAMEHAAETIVPPRCQPSATSIAWNRSMACVVELPAALIVLAEILIL